jgi:6-phosphofructokinase 1
MGRDAGFIALRSGLSTGAEGILVPELHKESDVLLEDLHQRLNQRRKSAVIVVAEGDQSGGAMKFSEVVQKRFPKADIRVTILGHIQRGGSPTAQDRILASRMGVGAVEALLNNKSGVMIGVVNGRIHHTPFAHATKHHTQLSAELLRLNKILSI